MLPFGMHFTHVVVPLREPFCRGMRFAVISVLAIGSSFVSSAALAQGCPSRSLVWSLGATTPDDGAVDVELDAPIFIVGEEEDKPSDPPNHAAIWSYLTVSVTREGDSTAIPGKLSEWAFYKGVAWVPDVPLEPMTQYHVSFDVEPDPKGGAATGLIHKESSFTTGSSLVAPLQLAPPNILFILTGTGIETARYPLPADVLAFCEPGIGDTQGSTKKRFNTVGLQIPVPSGGWLQQGTEFQVALTHSVDEPADYAWQYVTWNFGDGVNPSYVNAVLWGAKSGGQVCAHIVMSDAHSRNLARSVACADAPSFPPDPAQPSAPTPNSTDQGCALSMARHSAMPCLILLTLTTLAAVRRSRNRSLRLNPGDRTASR